MYQEKECVPKEVDINMSNNTLVVWTMPKSVPTSEGDGSYEYKVVYSGRLRWKLVKQINKGNEWMSSIPYIVRL